MQSYFQHPNSKFQSHSSPEIGKFHPKVPTRFRLWHRTSWRTEEIFLSKNGFFYTTYTTSALLFHPTAHHQFFSQRIRLAPVDRSHPQPQCSKDPSKDPATNYAGLVNTRRLFASVSSNPPAHMWVMATPAGTIFGHVAETGLKQQTYPNCRNVDGKICTGTKAKISLPMGITRSKAMPWNTHKTLSSLKSASFLTNSS